MAQLSNFLVAPRSYSRHQRHRSFARIGLGANQFSAFLAAQATRLTSTSSALFTKLNKNKAVTIASVSSTSQLN